MELRSFVDLDLGRRRRSPGAILEEGSLCPAESSEGSFAAAFTEEHQQIDAGIEEYLAGSSSTHELLRRARPLVTAMEALRRHIYLEEDLSVILEDGSADTARMETACAELLALLYTHNSKEEPIIYPHLDADLDPAEQTTIRELLTQGTLPHGWVCQALR